MTHGEFRLPDLGEGLTDAELVSWSVAVGDEVSLNQTIAEVETAKAMVELPSPFAGRVTELLAHPGDTVAVGAPLIRIAAPAEPALPPADSPAAATEQPARQTVLVGYGPEDTGPSRRRTAAPPPTASPAPAASGRVLAKPRARKLARELGVDLRTLASQQPVTVAQVRAAAAPGNRETREPASPVRKRTAAAMTESAREIPQVAIFHTTDASSMLKLTHKLSGTAQLDGIRITPLVLIAKLTLLALRAHPLLNARWDAQTSEIVQRHTINLGIAVATSRGLLVPAIPDAGQLTLGELGATLTTGVAAARDGTASPAELTGSTFTISNFGVFGVDAGIPMVPPGTSAILGLGAIRKQPLVIGGKVRARKAITLSLAFDHRLIDGDAAARFLHELAGTIADPGLAVRY